MNTTSIISLDLGGKNTGFFSCTTNDFNNLKNFQSGTIIYDESFILSQVNRRGKRHTKRNNLRRKLVKRVFLLILKESSNSFIQKPDSIKHHNGVMQNTDKGHIRKFSLSRTKDKTRRRNE